MAKTRKVLDIQVEGKHLVCIQNNDEKKKLFRLYLKSWEHNKYGVLTERRKRLADFDMFWDVIYYLERNWSSI